MTLSDKMLADLLPDREYRYYDSVDSTQDLALEWLSEGAEAGSVIVADEQRKGRGRHGRTWYTPPGVAIAMSVILRPTPKALPQITMLGALSIYDMLVELGADNVGIKWPNDVQLGGRKVSGVLPEASWTGDKLEGVALGMGINIRADFAATDLATTATSIEPALGHAVSRSEVVAILMARVDHWNQRLTTPEVFDTWRSRLDTLGKQVTVGEVSGLAMSVDPSGALLIRDNFGETRRVLAGDVALS